MSAEQRLIEESPQLLALYRLLEPTLPADGERTEAMRKHLRDRGVRPAMWRLLHRAGTAWMAELRPFYLRDRHRQPQVAVDILLVTQSFGTDHLVPVWMIKAFMSLSGNPNRPRAAYHSQLGDLYDLAARMGAWVQSERLRPVVQEHVHALFNWANEDWSVYRRYDKCRVTLSGLLRRMRLHEQRQLSILATGRPWRIPQGVSLGCRLDGYQAVLLSDAYQLWEESRVMHHCANQFQSACAQGTYFVVSIRPLSGGRPLATVGLRRVDYQVVFDQVTGFANTQVSAPIRREAVRLAAELRWQLRVLPVVLDDAPDADEEQGYFRQTGPQRSAGAGLQATPRASG